MSRVSFASRNYFSSIFLTAFSLVAGFVATPWLLKWLGTERFGAFRVTSDWFGYLTFFELGLGGALLPLLARALGRNEQASVRDLLAAGIRVYLGITCAMLVAGLLLALFITRVIAVSPQHASDLRAGCFIGLLSILWLPLASPFRALLDARQRSYWIASLLTLQTLLITGVGLLLAWMNWGITGQFIALLAGGAVFNVALVWKGMRSYPGLVTQVLERKYDKAATRELWKLNIPTYIVGLCGRVSLATDNIVVAAILGPVMVVPLILTQRLAVLLQAQLQGIGNASWAGLAELYSREEHNTFRHRVVELTGLTCILAIACLIPVAAFNRPFISLWVGPLHYGGQWMTLFAVLNAFLLSIISLWGWVFTGTGEVKRIVRPLIFQTLFNFVASVVLTRPLGAVGPLVGTFIGFAAVTVWSFPLQMRKTFAISTRDLLGVLIKPVLLGVPYSVGLWLFERTHVPGSWFALAGEMLLAAIFYLVLAWWLALTPSVRKAWQTRVQFFRFRPADIAFNSSAAILRPNQDESTLRSAVRPD